MTGRTSAGSGPPVDEAELLDDPVGYYPGFDRFGRLALQIWADGALDTQWISSGLGGAYYPTKPEIVALEYGYDLNGNRTSAYDLRQGNEWPMNHRYSYDGLNRLTMAERNARSEFVFSAPTEAPEKGSQAWLLDPLGNWLELETWSSSSTSATETRTHNKVNELLDRDIPGTSADHTLAYDNAGNLYTDAVSGGSTTTYTHDLWNRLVKVTVGSTVKLEQQFNGLTWRMLKREDTGGSAGLDEERTFTYNANWQLIEERVDANYISSPSLDKRVQYFWGLRYIDDCLMHRADLNNDGDYLDSGENTWYHMTDGMFSSVAILDRAAAAVERVSYDSYGKARHHRPGDLDGDGKVDGSDLGDLMSVWNTVITDSGYRGDADFNRDGTIDGDDLGSLFGFWGAALPAGQISFTTAGGPDNSIGWDGYAFNPVVANYLARNRTYEPPLGRWGTRDPAGYVDGASFYQYVTSRPNDGIDPSGLDRLVFAFEGLGGHPTDGAFANPSLNLVEQYWMPLVRALPATQGFYFGQGDAEVSRAVAQATELATEPDPYATDPNGCYHTVVAIGFSNGGRAAIQFAEKLRDRNIRVDLGFTADPVPKGLELFPPLTFFPGMFLIRPANTDEWENHFQRTDTKSLGGVLGIKGHRVGGANNYEIFHLGDRAHMEIVKDVRLDMMKAVSRVAINRGDWRWR